MFSEIFVDEITASRIVLSVGLALDILGAFLIARPLLNLSKRQVLAGGSKPFWSPNTEEEAQRDPEVLAFLQQIRGAKVGIWFLVGGFGLQLIANWLR